jgi:hypothetical protein
VGRLKGKNGKYAGMFDIAKTTGSHMIHNGGWGIF